MSQDFSPAVRARRPWIASYAVRQVNCVGGALSTASRRSDRSAAATAAPTLMMCLRGPAAA